MMLRADLHVHSAASWDGRSTLSELAAAAQARGLDAIAICDHDSCTDVSGSYPVLLIPGVEITTTGGHILGLFLQRPLDAALWAHGAPAPDAAIRAVRACGGLAVPAHPFSPQKLPDAALRALSPDGLECENARVALRHADCNARARALAELCGLPQTGGSDAHSAAEVGGCYTQFFCEERSLASLRASLAAGQTRAVFDHACRWRQKGLSQWRGYRHDRSLKKRCKALGYLTYCVLRDVFSGR